MPLLMVIAERRWLRTGDPVYLDLAKRWSRGTAILFAVGAVSGTVLSFELGLLWPAFMELAGPIIGLPFSLEGFAFFTEAIFLGIYLYGWERVSPRVHLLSGVAVLVSGVASGIFVVIANAWMNAPTGFELVDGRIVGVDPLAAMANPAAFTETLHMTLAAFVATGFAVAGIHAFLLLRRPASRFHRRALVIGLLVGAPAAVVQPLTGDLAARYVARHQPAKLAAMEALFETRRGAPLLLGGIPDVDSRRVQAVLLEIRRLLVDDALHLERGQVARHGADDAVVSVGLDRLDELPVAALELRARRLAVGVLDLNLLNVVRRELVERARLGVGIRRLSAGFVEEDVAAKAAEDDQERNCRRQPTHPISSATR